MPLNYFSLYVSTYIPKMYIEQIKNELQMTNLKEPSPRSFYRNLPKWNNKLFVSFFYIKVRGNEPSQPQQMWCDILGGNEKLTLSDHKFQVQWGILNSYVQSPGTIKYIAH